MMPRQISIGSLFEKMAACSRSVVTKSMPCLLMLGFLSIGAAGVALAQDQAPAPQDAPAASSPDTGAPAAVDGDEKSAPVPFADGTFTIVEQPEEDKILAYDGKEIARDYYVGFDRIAKVGGIDVALFNVGSGGNQCGPATIIAWKPEGSARCKACG